ncbi:MAG: ABC transporter ATP-binding protein [Actinobacteria bacterium]|nr:ABC transporter ATP-binding protein [Actinomycetota bacterium]
MPNFTRRGTTGDGDRAPAVAQPAAGLDVRGLRLSYGAPPVLRGVDVAVPPGGLVALLGPSGCGKTTLLRAVAGLERPGAGVVAVGGRVLTGPGAFVDPERRRVGMVFQDWALFPHMTVGRNVGFGLSRQRRQSGGVDEALALVELTGLSSRLPATLSGGQQQRVALARALAGRPALLLLDEPFSNLDTSLRAQVRAEVTALLRRLGMTALFVTHDQEEAFVLGDEVAIMLDGRIEQQAPPGDLYAAPASRAVARFVGDSNLLPGRAHGPAVTTAVGAVPLRESRTGDVEVLVRPEDLVVREGEDASVTDVEFYGHDAVYVVRPNGGPTVRARILTRPRFAPGDSVALDYAGAPTVAYAVTGRPGP